MLLLQRFFKAVRPVLTATAHRTSSAWLRWPVCLSGAGRAVVRCFIFPPLFWPAGQRGVERSAERRGGVCEAPMTCFRGTIDPNDFRGLAAKLCEMAPNRINGLVGFCKTSTAAGRYGRSGSRPRRQG